MRRTDRVVITGTARADTMFRRLVRYMLNPGRVVVGLPVAWALAWIDYGHRVTQDRFWPAYGAWFGGLFIVFWVLEAYRWAGGRFLGEPRS